MTVLLNFLSALENEPITWGEVFYLWLGFVCVRACWRRL